VYLRALSPAALFSLSLSFGAATHAQKSFDEKKKDKKKE